jgi:hypothetical protein
MRKVWVGGLGMLLACAMVLVTGCEGDSSSSSAEGSGSIRGQVNTDNFTGVAAVVPGLLIGLEGPVDMETTTDEGGNFAFNGLPAGEYTLLFYVNGQALEYKVTVVEGQSSILAHVRINEDGTITVYEERDGGGVDLTGDWTYQDDYGVPATVANGTGLRGVHLILTQNGSSLTGSLEGYSIGVTGSVSGNNVTLNFSPIDAGRGAWTATGTVSGDSMSGEWQFTPGGIDIDGGTWSATRGWEGKPL